MFEYFYNEIFRKVIIGFGSLFNNIRIVHTDENGQVIDTIKVPIAYGPTQKFLARLRQVPNLNKPVQITLPRMSFEFVGLTYDPTRKVTQTQTFLSSVVGNSTQIAKTYMPVPYNMQFELSIYTKLNDDMLQIIEQIFPYFQPSYNLTLDLISSIGEKKDIPIVFESISMSDDYEGDFDSRRSLIYTLRFTAKTYLFGPTDSSAVSKNIIQKVSIGYIGGDVSNTASRDLTYSSQPRAIQNYTGTVLTTLNKDLPADATVVSVVSASGISKNTYIAIDNEEMYVTSISNNLLTVKRGSDGTSAAAHVSGTGVKNITTADSALIPAGDDFGFNGTV